MNNYYLLISWATFFIHTWEHELTTEVIQKYHAPNSLIRKLEDMKTNKVIKYENYYIKPDVSRIVGVERLKKFIAQSHYKQFGIPKKFLVPAFDKNGQLKFDQSYVVSRAIKGNYLTDISDVLMEQLVDISLNSGISDFSQRNMLIDNKKMVWFIDTQLLYKSDILEATAESILDSHQSFMDGGYSFSYASQRKLMEYVSSPISQRRFKDLQPGMQSSDYV